jgi:hypothetical protein
MNYLIFGLDEHFLLHGGRERQGCGDHIVDD